MMEYRDYMRAPSYSQRPSLTKTLLACNAGAFLLRCILERVGVPVHDLFALSSSGLLHHGLVWQLLTYQFMHIGFWHLFLNCLGIFFIGSPVEQALGRSRFLALYLSGGIIGGLLQLLAGCLFGGSLAAPMVGASAAVMALVGAFSLLFPDYTIKLFAVIPVRARYFPVLCAGIAILGLLFPADDNTAETAHLGGLFAGMGFVRLKA